MKSGCLCVSECGVLKLSTGDDTPHRCHSETTCNTHSQTYWKTHSHTLKPTHLSGGFEIELGLGTNTPNNYPSLLRLVIHFAWIYSHLPLFFPFFPLLLCSTFHILTSLFSPPSQVMVSFPWALRQNVTIQQSCVWLMAADACHIMSTLWLLLSASGTLYPMNAIFFLYFCNDEIWAAANVDVWRRGKHIRKACFSIFYSIVFLIVWEFLSIVKKGKVRAGHSRVWMAQPNSIAILSFPNIFT